MTQVMAAVATSPRSPLQVARRGLAAGLTAALDLAESAPATLIVVILMAAVWVVGRDVIGQVHGTRTIGYLAVGALPNADIPGRGSPDQWWRFISSGLVHDRSSPLHLLGNSAALLMVGSAIERLYGRLAVVAALSLGVAAGGVAWLFATELDLVAEPDYTVGCSAGICALVGMMLVYGYRERHHLGLARAAAMKAQATLGISLMLLLGLLVPNLNNVAHAGGLVSGALVACLLPTAGGEDGPQLGRRSRAAAAAMVVVSVVSIGFAAQNLVVRLLA